MTTTSVYEQILDELAQGELEDLEIKVFHALKRVYPKARTRRGLIEDVFDFLTAPTDDLNNSSQDRKIRKAIESLFEKGVPIISTSGGAGYCIDVNPERWSEMLRELESRRESIGERIEAAKRIQAKIKQIGINVIPPTVPTTPKQLALMEMES